MKKIIVLVSVLMTVILCYAQIEKLDYHSTIMLDAKFFSGDNANDDSYANSNRFQIRKASFGLEGEINQEIEYALEFGVSTCTGSSANVQISEAVLMYKLFKNTKIGFQQGHILSSFANKTECPARLTLDKPDFIKTFGDCHPFGFVVNNYTALGDFALESELSFSNGTNTTINGEKQYNVALMLETPLNGLSLITAYNGVKKGYYNNLAETVIHDGYRVSGGMNYEQQNIWLTAEYFTGKAFVSKDQKMNAWYAQAGYDIPVNQGKIKSLQPYIQYQQWDQNSDSSLSANKDLMEAGINLKMSEYTKIRLGYILITEDPENSAKSPDSFVVRLQTGF
jgi:hypothetical protein